MRGISTTISIVDQMTAPIMVIQHAVSGLENRFNTLETATNVDSSSLQAMRNQIDLSDAATRVLNDNMELVENNINQNTKGQSRFNNTLVQGNSHADSLTSKIGAMIAMYASVRGIRLVLGLSDEVTQTTARLNLMNDGLQTTEELQEKIFQSAQRSRGAYLALGSAVSKLGILASDAFKNNDEIIAFTELMNKNFVIGGTAIEEQSAAMYQLTQAMAAGKLQGDEYRSILENAPMLANAIKDYMTNAGVEGTMKDWAAEGLLTADVIKNALFSVADETNAKFNEMPMTFGQIATSIQNQAIVAFQPVLERLNQIANSPEFQILVQNVISTLTTVANVVMEIFSFIASIAQFASENWSWLGPIIWGIVAAIVAWQVVTTIMTAIQWLLNLALSANPIGIIVLAIAAIIGAIVAWANAVGGFRALWLIVVNAILTAWDWVKIGFFTGIHWVLDLWDSLRLGIMIAATAISAFMGDMKANVLMILQNMVNGAISIINGFIGVLNNLPGVNIPLISAVTFGTEAQLANEAAKQAGAAGLADFQAEIDAAKAGRAGELDQMAADARAAEIDRLAGIADAQADNAANAEADKTAGAPGGDMPGVSSSPYDGAGSGIDGIGGSAANIDANTAKQLDYSEEELKLWRDLAERDVINRYTTAEVNVEFGDVNNTVSSDMDLDGIVDYIAENLENTLFEVAEGVHA